MQAMYKCIGRRIPIVSVKNTNEKALIAVTSTPRTVILEEMLLCIALLPQDVKRTNTVYLLLCLTPIWSPIYHLHP